MSTVANHPSLALYQADIPQNLGAVMRLSACFGMALHLIEPCGFPLDDKRIRRAAMDYIEQVQWHRHASWEAFYAWSRVEKKRLLLLTTKASEPYETMRYSADDVLLFGRESAGVPQAVHEAVDGRLTITMQEGVRSLNLGMSAAIVAGEAIRQLRG